MSLVISFLIFDGWYTVCTSSSLMMSFLSSVLFLLTRNSKSCFSFANILHDKFVQLQGSSICFRMKSNVIAVWNDNIFQSQSLSAYISNKSVVTCGWLDSLFQSHGLSLKFPIISNVNKMCCDIWFQSHSFPGNWYKWHNWKFVLWENAFSFFIFLYGNLVTLYSKYNSHIIYWSNQWHTFFLMLEL